MYMLLHIFLIDSFDGFSWTRLVNGNVNEFHEFRFSKFNFYVYSRMKSGDRAATTQISGDCGSPEALSHVTAVYYAAER